MQLRVTGAHSVEAWQDGGSMLGGPKRVVWHSTENDPEKTTAATIANYLNRVGYQVHIVWNPVTGEIVQMIPANRAGRGLRNKAGGVQTNREGSICVQCEVVGQASKPFTNGPMVGRDVIIAYLRQLGIPDVWPDGPPPAYDHEGSRSTSNWLKQSGHYSHSQVPENDHNDPGAIDINKLFGEEEDEVTQEDIANIARAVVQRVYNNSGDEVGQALQKLQYKGKDLIGDRLTALEAKVDQILRKPA